MAEAVASRAAVSNVSNEPKRWGGGVGNEAGKLEFVLKTAIHSS